MMIQREGSTRESRALVIGQIGTVRIEEYLDPIIHRTEMVGQQALLLAVVVQQVTGDFQEFDILGSTGNTQAEGSQLQVEVTSQLLTMFWQIGDTEAESAGQIHVQYSGV